jgi:alcohol dehydrogenase class IV
VLFRSPGFHPLADGIALEGMRLIQTYLPRACENGKDIEARSRMLAAASMGATAFQKGLGGVHAIAHPVGAFFNTHHGLTNAILLPYVLVHNRSSIEPQLAVIARTLNLSGEPYKAILEWMLAFRKRLNIQHTLAEIGVPLTDSEKIGHEASLDPSAGSNPVPIDAATYARLFRSAVKGDLTLAG